MGRSCGEALLIEVYAEGNESLGAELCKLCIKANLRFVHVAKSLHVTRMTLHSWLRGRPIRIKNKARVEAFMEAVKKDLEVNTLPVPSVPGSLAYCLGAQDTKT